jgi:hypothetical protein
VREAKERCKGEILEGEKEVWPRVAMYRYIYEREKEAERRQR